MANTRKETKITRHIGRKIQTAPYETLDVSIDSEDTITWEDIDERKSKMDLLTQLAILDYQKTEAQVLQELRLGKKSASVAGAGAKQETQRPVVKQTQMSLEGFDAVETTK